MLLCSSVTPLVTAHLLTCSWLRVVVRQVKPAAIFSTMTVKGRKEKGRNVVGGHATMSPMMTSVFSVSNKNATINYLILLVQFILLSIFLSYTIT